MYSAVLMLAMTAGAGSVEHCRGGCYGGCYGCSGYGGCYGGYRGGYCSGYYGGYGCYGGCSGYYGGYSGYYGGGCCGCYGGGYYGSGYGGGYYGYGGGYYGGAIVPAPVASGPAQSSTPATIVVNLPADARLIVEGMVTQSTGTRRTFVSPALPPGQSYVYTIRAEIAANGRTSTQTQEVIVRGGETSNVTFNLSSGTIASR